MPIFNDLEQFLEFKYSGVPIGRLVLSQIITDRRDSQIKFEEIKTRAIELAQNAIELYERSKLIIENNSIYTVYVWNGRRCSDGPVVYAAKHLKKKYYVHILACKGDENIYISNTTAVHDLQNNINNIDKYIDKEKKGLEYIVEEGHRFFELSRNGGKAAHSFKNFTTKFVSDDVQINRTKDKVI